MSDEDFWEDEPDTMLGVDLDDENDELDELDEPNDHRPFDVRLV